EEEARRHPQKNIITKAIGIEKELRLDEGDVKEVKLKPGDYLLLCSDGLSDALPDEDILKTVLSARSLQEAVKLLIDKAYSFGSDDNITVVLYRH
ncbi:SpoIIE family protein phosphatase, partial [Thermococcus sp.]